MLTRAESSTAGAMLSHLDINECSVVGGDVCVVHRGVAATKTMGNGRGQHCCGCCGSGSAVQHNAMAAAGVHGSPANLNFKWVIGDGSHDFS